MKKVGIFVLIILGFRIIRRKKDICCTYLKVWGCICTSSPTFTRYIYYTKTPNQPKYYG